MPKGKSLTTDKCLLEGAAKGLRKNATGEYIQWSAKSRDGQEMKVYIENGCTEGLKPAEVREKFPQFKKYNYQTFNSAFASLKKTYNNQIRDRGVTRCETTDGLLFKCFSQMN